MQRTAVRKLVQRIASVEQLAHNRGGNFLAGAGYQPIADGRELVKRMGFVADPHDQPETPSRFRASSELYMTAVPFFTAS